MADYYVREEDGTSRYILENASGDILLEVIDCGGRPVLHHVCDDGLHTVSARGQRSVHRLGHGALRTNVRPHRNADDRHRGGDIPVALPCRDYTGLR